MRPPVEDSAMAIVSLRSLRRMAILSARGSRVSMGVRSRVWLAACP